MTSYLTNIHDLRKIVSDAKFNIANMKLPIYVSEIEIEKGELTTVAILESLLMFLNSKNLLTKLVEFDYTDPCCDHEGMEKLEEREPKE